MQGTRSAFSSPGRSLVKTMVMTTGEFDFDGIFFNTDENNLTLFYPQIAYILWIVFIILMPIILTNLLVRMCVYSCTCNVQIKNLSVLRTYM